MMQTANVLMMAELWVEHWISGRDPHAFLSEKPDDPKTAGQFQL